MTDKEAFEAWAGKREKYHTTREWDAMHRAWQAATAAERARGAEVCESLRDTISDPLVIGEVAHHAGHNALQSAADAIRKGDT